MTRLKMLVHNDTTSHMRLRVNGLNGNDVEDMMYRLAPQSSKTIEFSAPAGSIPYFKLWDSGIAMVSWVKEKV